MDNKAVVSAAKRGVIPSALLSTFTAKYQYDPVEVARKIMKWEKRRTTISWLGNGILIPLAMVVLLAWSGRLSQANTVIPAICGAVWYFAICFPLYLIADFKADQRWVPIEVRSFGYELSRLLKWAGRDLASVAHFKGQDFRLLADRILIDQAKRVLQLEQLNANVPRCFWSDESAALKRDFGWQYETLKVLGLCDGPFHRFYNVAYCELDSVVAA